MQKPIYTLLTLYYRNSFSKFWIFNRAKLCISILVFFSLLSKCCCCHYLMVVTRYNSGRGFSPPFSYLKISSSREPQISIIKIRNLPHRNGGFFGFGNTVCNLSANLYVRIVRPLVLMADTSCHGTLEPTMKSTKWKHRGWLSPDRERRLHILGT